ncbi:hypothetical protein HDIA_2846 [Hartmannibacter diazotrophicus]|uniref:Uncharacterized protein n=1 Tax=Hartmannibacter diazotrophicus TaxID=1482074 RepID=A0A2C9D7U5_9HYPH|nr:hypothetical protein [Hartmannibacter diazotrophicus]SON56387.1 hypothetical protein HDIA_2846 [Hartmannibacter diazotrophicus]
MVYFIRERLLPKSVSVVFAGLLFLLIWAALVIVMSVSTLALYALSEHPVFMSINQNAGLIAAAIGASGFAIAAFARD